MIPSDDTFLMCVIQRIVAFYSLHLMVILSWSFKCHAMNMRAVDINLHYSVPCVLCYWLCGPAAFMFGESDPLPVFWDWRWELMIVI